jgi:twitching motility two-component system response regulator PilH
MTTVLIVDDVRTDRELMGKVVSDAGHHPEYASSGDEAIQRAKELKPALILMDVVMPPGISGFNACRNIKNDPATKAIPIVLVTSKGQESDVFWGRKQGADEHLAKPWSAPALVAIIRRFLEGGPSQVAPAPVRRSAPIDAVPKQVFEALLKCLAKQIGPMSRSVMDEELAGLGVTAETLGASDLPDLVQRLVTQIDEPEAKAAFLSAAASIVGR